MKYSLLRTELLGKLVVSECERTMTSSSGLDDSFKSEMRDEGARKTFKVDKGRRGGQHSRAVCRASLLSNAVMESEQDAGAITNAALTRSRRDIRMEWQWDVMAVRIWALKMMIQLKHPLVANLVKIPNKNIYQI